MRWLVLVLALALPATAAAATTTLDDQAVTQIARADARMAQVQRLHPLAIWAATYRPGSTPGSPACSSRPARCSRR